MHYSGLLLESLVLEKSGEATALTTSTTTTTFSAGQTPALSLSASSDLRGEGSYYLETSNEGGELVTHTRLKK